MKVINDDLKLVDFNAWSGAIDTKNAILSNSKGEEFDGLIEELYPDGVTDTELNDLLWFESEWIYESLGINQEEGEDEN